MRLLDLTLASAAENLALDEALLEAAEAAGRPSEVLRLLNALGGEIQERLHSGQWTA